MIDAASLLADLKRQLRQLEEDLRVRVAELPELTASLQAEWQSARDAERTAETFETWVEQVMTQAAVHWLLSCVFLRFIEDNELVERPWLAGTPDSGRLALARDRHEAYFRKNPLESDREYLLAAFNEAGAMPGLQSFFNKTHNPVFRLGISGDAAMAVRQFWQQIDPDTGKLIHDFTDAAWNTRFLGDLYQDLSEAARKRYALLQTPDFVEEFILDRTLTPAINEFGFRNTTMIDPTCGSGHFLLGGFERLVAQWQKNEPARNSRDIAQKALDAVAGVDLNPFAVAISRFRLLVAALKVCGVKRLSEAPNFKMNVATGDSLLHGSRFGLKATDDMFEGAEDYANTGLAHAYASEDLGEVRRILGRQYGAVVGNPPYVVVRDGALNAAYRQRYVSCHMKYSLGAPFTERFFELAVTGTGKNGAGFVGLITTNSFMKREFGRKLIEEVLPLLDVTHVIDTSGAYIPGHGTPTVILFGRHRDALSDSVRTVMGIKGEPSTPAEPKLGVVWSSIVELIDSTESENSFVDVADVPREAFKYHPWSVSGGGALDTKKLIETGSDCTLGAKTKAMGFFGISAADEIMLADGEVFARSGLDRDWFRPVISGDEVRDWSASSTSYAFFPYDEKRLLELSASGAETKFLWPAKSLLGARTTFSKRTYLEEGRCWWEWHQVALERIETPLTITFAEVATHNHFVLDRGGKVFKQTAPVIKLPAGSTEDDHLGLLGLLNSSVACFWLQQVCHNKGGPGGGSSKDEKWHDFFAFNSKNVAGFPVASEPPIAWAKFLDRAASKISDLSPATLLSRYPKSARTALPAAKREVAGLRLQMIAAQEELDWQCYHRYNILDSRLECADPPPIQIGERAFEIFMARQMEAGNLDTRWFQWLDIEPTTIVNEHWPQAYKDLVDRRIALIESDRSIGLLETCSFKRRWETDEKDPEREALNAWLLDRLESPELWTASREHPPQITTTSRLADRARQDADFMQIAELYAGHADFDPAQLIADLVRDESVPFLPALRYKETGLRKRAQWEATWALQRREDAGEQVGKIPVPPQYKNPDFLKASVWRLRGPLDVPKERWVSYPGCERGSDTSLPIAWAGWNHLQQATALASYYLEMKETEGWEAVRLQPLLAGLLELLPWLQQWHNEIDPVYGERMGDYYRGFIDEEARTLGFTLDALRAWRPAAKTTRSARKKAKA